VVSSAGDVEIRVVNGPMRGRPSGLELSGAERGLAGMRERVAACRGHISFGLSQEGGGWQVQARLPL